MFRRLRRLSGFCLIVLPLSGSYSFLDEGPLISRQEPKTVSSKLSDNARLELLSKLARQNSTKKSITSAKVYIAEAFDLAKRKNLIIPYNLYWADAEVLFQQKDYFGACQEMDKVCQILKKTTQFRETAEALTFQSRLLHYTGRFDKAIDIYYQVIQMAEENHLVKIIPECYRGLADVYNIAGKRKEEKESVLKLIETAKKENDQDYLSRGYYRLGQYTTEVDSNFISSNNYYKEALKIREIRKDSIFIPPILNRISWNYYLLKQLDTALKYFNKTLEISLRLNNYSTIANAYGNMGTIFRDMKEIDKALFFYEKSNAYAMITKDWFNLSWTNKDMSDMYCRLGDYKKAYECFILYKNFSDSLNQQRYSVGLADARMRYETDTKVKTLELVNMKVDQQRYFIFALSGFIFLILVIGFLLFRQSRLNTRRQISEMNRQISEITQANLRQQMNPHFIFNTLNSIQYYMYQHDKIAVNNYLTKFSSLMRKTLENSQHTAIPIKDELDALELYLELESLRFKEKFEYKIHVDEEIDVLLYKIPTMLLQPYVENAIGHGLINKEGKGILTIRIDLRQDYLYFTIEDNGIGREEAMKIKQSKEKNYPPLGTKITESRLEVANAFYGTRMKVQYTDLMDTNEKPAGTRVEIQIPILT